MSDFTEKFMAMIRKSGKVSGIDIIEQWFHLFPLHFQELVSKFAFYLFIFDEFHWVVQIILVKIYLYQLLCEYVKAKD